MTTSASSNTANPPCMKRLSSVGLNEPAQKRPPTPLEDKVVEPEVSRSRSHRGYQESFVAIFSELCMISGGAACWQSVGDFLNDGMVWIGTLKHCTFSGNMLKCT